MAYIFDEGDHIVVQIPLVYTKEGEVVEELAELVVEKNGKVLKGQFASVQEAYFKALEQLSKALSQTENFLDGLEYKLEMEENVKPSEIYTASYMAHALYYHAVHLYQLGVELYRRGLVTHRQLNFSRTLRRNALMLRRYARDVRLLHATVVQLLLNASMKKLTWLGTVVLPALLITSFYGMNLTWLPLADRPEAVFLILALVTIAFAYLINKI
ncbi:hypothetical protein PAE2442 [Pyrobaculum aerophilum str. IM2]|uniref:Magnesium transporter n=2 Tax=Pyrobaculum aerophilum TaxID=13773 RepID=Q8ZV61_PYRAE|nr:MULTISPECIES: magnesium transporter CorA family protein [Pyrobaculum]AAL64195.1 hypothetical protein PAE2442 [Pyrobaculum aerophilum str. IM2]HII47045.1 magnesium transporter CorA family protein [Pyrobaculum aerophilum]